MSATAAELTIMRAAANIAREDAISLAVNASTAYERDVVSAGLLAQIAIEKYLAAREDLDRPF